MTTIETERLVIRNFHGSDWDALHVLIAQYHSSEYAAYDQPWPTSAEEIKGITEWFASSDNFLAVCLKDRNQFIGFVSLTPEQTEGNRVFNLGYIFNATYHGKGYATESCQAVLRHAFDELQAQAVITGTAAVNRSSCRLLGRLGFHRTAERISSFQTNADGKPIEFLGYTYAIAKDEWVKKRKNG